MSAPDTSDRAATREWRDHLIETRDGIRRVLERMRRVAVLGIKPETHAHLPAFYVAHYAARAGLEIIPVPVYYPEVTEILGRRVYRRLADIPGDIDLVNVFRRSHDIPPHLDDILAKRPRAVWFQSGIRNDAAAETLARAGIDVVQDRCLMVELRGIGR
jgi:predicted CoA-binding protein